MAEKIIKVFISSTFEDFQEEREIVERAILELNPSFNQFEMALLPVNLKSGARTNPSKEECLAEVMKSDVLIGLLGLRYGEVDLETGKSITELEYDKAYELRLPALMYVRKGKVEPEWMDTDEELITKREAFREKVEQRHKRETFGKSHELRADVIRDLSHTALEKYVLPVRVSEGQAIESPETPTKASVDKIASSERKLPASIEEINQLFNFISDNLSDLRNIDGQKKGRLLLLATSMFYGKELSGGLGTHEIQLLYRQRKNMSLLTSEISFLVKNVYADVYRIKAGWFWVQDFKSRFVLGHLQWLCINEEDEDIRIGCLGLLKNFWSDKTGIVITDSVSSNKKKVRLEALKILEELASEKCLDILEKAATDQDIDIQKGARRAKLAILARYDPPKAASYIEEFENEYATGSASALSEIMPKLKVDGLRKLKQHKDEKIKQIAMVELGERGELDNNELKVLTNESDVELRYLGYKGLIDKGEKFNIEEVRKSWPKQGRYIPYTTTLLGSLFTRVEIDRINEVTAKILKTYSMEELTKSLDWMSPDRELVYLELGLRKGHEVLRQVREDLDNKFDRIKKAYVEKLNHLRIFCEKTNDKGSVDRIQEMIDQFGKESHKYGEMKFTGLALKILMEHGEKEDIRFAKQFRTSDEHSIKEIATELFVKHANKEELSILVDIALNENGEIKAKAARKALSLDKEELASEKFFKSNDPTLVKLCLRENLKKKLLLKEEKIWELLLSDNENIREITVAYLMKVLGKKRIKLEQILDEYLDKRPHYYNVVCWLDRVLYAPRTFKMLFRKQLAAKLDE